MKAIWRATSLELPRTLYDRILAYAVKNDFIFRNGRPNLGKAIRHLIKLALEVEGA